ncbi:MAG: biopolymer transporter ExbD [Deltaproteobacteria bacterium]|nr:biopolymer transporter ExbD [Deltaproteobacteria bacterium]
MDIVTNLLVYTIKIFAVSVIFVQDASIELPLSSTQEDPENAVVVVITGIRPEEKEKPSIVVDGRVIDTINPKTYRIPQNAKHNGFIIKNLKNELKRIRANQAHTAELTKGTGFNGHVVIVADRLTPYRILIDVLATCGEAGFGNFEFAVVKQEA